MKHPIITQSPSDIHSKSVKLSINLVKYEKQYSPSEEAMISVTSRPQHHKILPWSCPHIYFLAFLLVAMLP